MWKHFVSTTNIIVVVLIIVWTWATTHEGNDSTWGLKWHFHSHLSWMILTVSDRNYCFVSSRILSLHLAFTINGKTFYFFKDKPLDVTFSNFLPLNLHICLCLVTFFSPFPKRKKKKSHTSFYLNQISKSTVRIASI